MYGYLVRLHTTTNMTPDEVHAVGLREVTRIRGEMEAVKARADSAGRSAVLHLPSDRFEVLLQRSKEPLLPIAISPNASTRSSSSSSLGCRERRMACRPFPTPSLPTPRLRITGEPAADGSRAGTFFVNLYKPGDETYLGDDRAHAARERARPSLCRSRSPPSRMDIPQFRRHARLQRPSSKGGRSTPRASARSWALYDGSVRKDAVSSPTRCGAPFDSWSTPASTTCTGTASVRSTSSWRTRRESELDVVNEVDRYIVWPGQALAYKIGELRIKAMRQKQMARRATLRCQSLPRGRSRRARCRSTSWRSASRVPCHGDVRSGQRRSRRE